MRRCASPLQRTSYLEPRHSFRWRILMSEEEKTVDTSSSERPSEMEQARSLAAAKQRLESEIRRRIVGQRDVVEALLISLFANGHSLFVGVPGLAKTKLIATLAGAMSLSFRRIQFTPDLMPSDITGTEVIEEDRSSGRREFRFVPGPIFANILLADEINRTPPKTQAALLEAMQEGKVTAGGATHSLGSPFLVFATQNPIEQEGTYPLPEAQLDRFLFAIHLGYPSAEEEAEIVRRTTGEPEEPIKPVLSPEDVLAFQGLVRKVPVPDSVIQYAVELVRKTRPKEAVAPDFIKEFISLGGGPRASQSLIMASKAKALLEGRLTISREDVRVLAPLVLRHRMMRNFKAEAQNVEIDSLLTRLCQMK
jgi:MoxR-like ATPase